MKKVEKNIFWLIASVLVSFALVVQIKSFDNITPLLRDQETNVFQEIQILRTTNAGLTDEIEELNDTLEQLSDQSSAIEALDEEARKYQKLNGKNKVYGPGVSVRIDGDLTVPWIIDLVNELFAAGAQAVAVNDIRLTNQTIGFDTLPQGQILLNGSILSEPYEFKAIGESRVLMDSLELSGGILDRLQSNFPEIELSLKRVDIIQID